MDILQVKNQKILISPLNWGMGHISRCIGIIDQLLKQENEVIIACNLDQKMVFQLYFPNAVYEELNGYPFSFKGKGNFAKDLLSSSGALYQRLKKETIEVEVMIAKHGIDLVLSDHRYGFYAKNVCSVFITHQYNLPFKNGRKIVNGIHHNLINKFDFNWILDTDSNDFAGDLSKCSKENAHYIGVYSRFHRKETNHKKRFSTVLLASGPLVYAQQLIDNNIENPEIDLFLGSEKLNFSGKKHVSGNWPEIDEILRSTENIISYCGYSTIMDSQFLDATFDFSATKGQLEQEYLLKRFNAKK